MRMLNVRHTPYCCLKGTFIDIGELTWIECPTTLKVSLALLWLITYTSCVFPSIIIFAIIVLILILRYQARQLGLEVWIFGQVGVINSDSPPACLMLVCTLCT